MLALGDLRLHSFSSYAIANLDFMIEKPADHMSQGIHTAAGVVTEIKDQRLLLPRPTEYLPDLLVLNFKVRHLADFQITSCILASGPRQSVGILQFPDKIPESRIAGQVNQLLQLLDPGHYIYFACLPIGTAQLNLQYSPWRQNVENVFHSGKVIPIRHNAVNAQHFVSRLEPFDFSITLGTYMGHIAMIANHLHAPSVFGTCSPGRRD